MLLFIQSKFQLLRKLSLSVSLLISLIIGLSPEVGAAVMPDTTNSRVAAILDVASERLQRANVIQAFLDDNPLPRDASTADVERYQGYQRLKGSLEKQAEKISSFHKRLTDIMARTYFSNDEIRQFNEILNKVEARIQEHTLADIELVPAAIPQRIPANTEEEAPKATPLDQLESEVDRMITQDERRSSGSKRRRERRQERREESREENALQDPPNTSASLVLNGAVTNEDTGSTTGDDGLEAETEAERIRREREAAQAKADAELKAEQERLEAERIRRETEAAQAIADAELKAEQERLEAERIRRETEAAQAIADAELKAEQERLEAERNRISQNDDNSDSVEESRTPAGGRSHVDPYTQASPPYRATPGRIWVRDVQTKRWGLITEGEFIEKRRDRLRDKYSGALGRKLPVSKSIRVLDLNTGRERWLKANRDFEIQVVGFAPRGMIRVKVFDKNGNEVSGDFVTMKFNVEKGTEAAAARDALNALREIRDAGHIENSCRVAPALPSNGDDPITGDTGGNTGDVQDSDPVDTNGYRPGCQALADGIDTSDRDQLRQCMSSILSFIKGGANRCDQIERMFALKEKEQDFAALLMTTKGEAPGGLPAGSPDHLMIMKSLENRKNAVNWWGRPLSVMDIALQPWQYSMFNDWDKNKRFDGNNFLSTGAQYHTLIDSLITYQTADWQPPGTIDDITHYYSPPAMRPRNSQPRWVSHNRNGTEKEVTSQIRVNGEPVVNSSNSSNGYHRFYTGVDGRANYSARRKSRSSIINGCRR